jgi:uncharacterized protein YdhG (YjbR/CyaY superfamily)
MPVSRTTAKSPAKRPAAPGFSAEEKAAARERVRELKRSSGNGEADVLEKIAEMEPSDRAMAEKIHRLVRAVAPSLEPRTWYGMPAYGTGAGVLCYFRNASKFKTRYATLGFSDKAKLDDGSMWPTEFALSKVTAADEARIRELLKRALG